ncbi:hypothetical protein Y032_0136g1949 [Ancylostoma ceylanicum]|uniref:Paired domain-containing protein n=1 Tax=Ancylostoma ceylanicum TaxID=53326 RepID=A0A016T5F0_9BILA|nr:hypothetical protein Y032_0136g1949 [Ancylostoma ceylanicum]
MIAANPKRASIADLHTAGYATGDIAKMLDVGPRTVRRASSRFRDTGGITDRPRSGRRRTAVVRKNVEIIRKRIGWNSKRSMRKVDEDLKISDRSVSFTVSLIVAAIVSRNARL